MNSVEEIEELIQSWEQAVEWIARGWDNIEGYENDVGAHEVLAEAIDEWLVERLLKPLRARIQASDEAFRPATVASRLCVFHCGPPFRAFPNGRLDLLFEHYDPDVHWYLFRWQPDCPYPRREHDGISYQREQYGMDFENMSEAELKEAARQEVARWHEMHGLPSPWKKQPRHPTVSSPCMSTLHGHLSIVVTIWGAS